MQNKDCRQDDADINGEYLLAANNGETFLVTSIIATRSQTSSVSPNGHDVKIICSIEPAELKVAECCQSSSSTSNFREEKGDNETVVFIGSNVPGGSPVSCDVPNLDQPTVMQAETSSCNCADYPGGIQDDVLFDGTGGDDERIDLRERTSEPLDLCVSSRVEKADNAQHLGILCACKITEVRSENDESGVSKARLFKSSSFDSHKSKYSTNGCATCAEFHEFLRSYFMTDVDRGEKGDGDGEGESQCLNMDQMLAMVKIKLSQSASTSVEVITDNSLLQSKVNELETELLYLRNSILRPPSTTIPSELFKECSRLRWRVLELEKLQRTESSDVIITSQDNPGAYEISVDSSEPFSAHSSTRKRGHKIRRSISGLQRSSRSPSSPESPQSSSPTPTSTSTSIAISTSSSLTSPSSSFPSMAATFHSLQSIWKYRLSSVISKKEQSDIKEKERLSNRFNIRQKLSMRCEDDKVPGGKTENMELTVQVPSDTVEVCQVDDTQGKLRTCHVQGREAETIQDATVEVKIEYERKEIEMGREREREEECVESKRLQKVKEKLKRNLKERISRKKSQTEQFEMEIKEKEKKKSDRAYASYVSAVMVKVNELILIHDQKERDFSELVEELEGTVSRLAYDLHIARTTTPLEYFEVYKIQSSEEEYTVCGERSISEGAKYYTPLHTEYGSTHKDEGDGDHQIFNTPREEGKYGFQNGGFLSPTKTDSSYSTDSHDDDLGCSSKLNVRNLKNRASDDMYMSTLLCSTSFSSATTSPAVSSASSSPFDESLYRSEYQTYCPTPSSAIVTDQSVAPCSY